ncbi:MAG TPA: enoyl-CoA hydratase-related protein [Candidatus Acidoferrum sp.]|nr:enoyl-CoA hydratase-related protein [Candidatus Acidoferrum sp.]
MKFTTIKITPDPFIFRITLARPEKRNAISAQMIVELLRAFEEAESSRARVVILSAEGKAFCAGMDLAGLQTIAKHSPEQNVEDSRRMALLFRRLYTFPRPVIAAVNGAAIAGGCGIATLADFTLAAPEAKFGYTEVRIGFVPALVSVFLRRQIGDKRSRELLLTGKIIGAEEAFRLGLATEIVPAEKLAARADELAASLLAVSPTSVARTKDLLTNTQAAALDEELEWAVRANAEIRATADFREGLASFLEKREPKWSGE